MERYRHKGSSAAKRKALRLGAKVAGRVGTKVPAPDFYTANPLQYAWPIRRPSSVDGSVLGTGISRGIASDGDVDGVGVMMRCNDSAGRLHGWEPSPPRGVTPDSKSAGVTP